MSSHGAEQGATTVPEPVAPGPSQHPAPQRLFRGIDLWDAGDVASALEEFDGVLSLQPKNDLARSYRALCLLAAGDQGAAAEVWKEHGFSDNTMFRVRLVEYVERQWLERGAFMGEAVLPNVDGLQQGSGAPRKALRRFYRRDFKGMLRHLKPPPVENEIEAYLGATACEMLRYYGRAGAYLDALRPRRDEWPDALVALGARLDVRRGNIPQAARDFASIVVMGPEDFGMNYYLGVICLAYERRDEARQYFIRALTNYMVDTLEFQWWQIERTLLQPSDAAAGEP